MLIEGQKQLSKPFKILNEKYQKLHKSIKNCICLLRCSSRQLRIAFMDAQLKKIKSNRKPAAESLSLDIGTKQTLLREEIGCPG